jgi:hypothetical protein
MVAMNIPAQAELGRGTRFVVMFMGVFVLVGMRSVLVMGGMLV